MISLSIWILSAILLTCRAQEYYVTTNSSACPSHATNCRTLDDYASYGSAFWFGKKNVSLIFLEGNHTTNKLFHVVGINFLTVTSSGDTDSLLIFDMSIFWVEASNSLVMENLNFDNCILHSHYQSSSTNITGVMLIRELNLRNSDVFIHSAIRGHPLLVELKELRTDNQFYVDSYMHTVLTISSCVFQQPLTLRTGYEGSIIANVIDCTFRGINHQPALQFSPLTTVAEDIVDSLTIENVSFIGNGFTGLEINIPMDVIINGSQFINNSGLLGIDLFFPTVLTISNCIFQQPVRVTQFYEGSITDSTFRRINHHPALLFPPLTTVADNFEGLLTLKNVSFIDNGATGLEIQQPMDVIINGSQFINNSGLLGIDLFFPTVLTISNCIFQQPVRVTQFYEGSITDSTFRRINHHPALLFPPLATVADNFEGLLTLKNVSFVDNGATGLEIQQPMDVIINGSQFINNSGLLGGAIDASDSRLFFIGDNLFHNNSGSNGGALHLLNSTIWLEEDSNITFKDNRASEIGGAISSEPGCAQGNCFYSLTFDIDEHSTSIPVSIVFENNTAVSGSDIYGAGLQNDCKVTPNGTDSCYIQNSIFTFLNRTASSVSTSPKRVCLCDENDVPQCANIDYIFYNVSAAAGEKFTLSAVLVGEDFFSVVGGVYASSVKQAPDFTFGSSRNLQLSEATENCTLLEYSVEPNRRDIQTVSFILSRDRVAASIHQEALTKSSPDSVKTELENSIWLYDNSSCINDTLLNAAIVINVTILPCPRGFNISEDNVCTCDPQLTNFVGDCITENNSGLLYRNGDTWIGPNDSENNSDSILVHSFCPFDYCYSSSVGVDLNNPDSQCALNHSGVLCGGCLPGLSLAIGSSRCMNCTNENGRIALLVAFLVAGVVLVLFIKVLDLTVAHGTINGLIFYANVVWIHQGIFFPNFSGLNDEHNTTLEIKMFLQLFDVMKGFIAWLNLDLGIETCFFDGLDAYWKTWLQFAFPLYLWFLAGLIVLLCHCSIRATRMFGNNAVGVLCTVILLSYMKLLRTIVLALSPAVLQKFFPDGTKCVWLIDGNVDYLGLEHSFLFGVALLILLFLWLPYTFALLFVRCLQRFPCTTCFMPNLKPFIDFYTGPLKGKHHYWVGLTLLGRVILAITAIVSQTVSPSLSISFLCIMSAILCALVVNVYKRTLIAFLELLFLFNVISLGIAFLSFEEIESRAISSCVSSFVCLLLFIVILCYHVYLTLRKCFHPNHKNGYRDIGAADLGYDERDDQIRVATTSTIVGLREELLSSTEV